MSWNGIADLTRLEEQTVEIEFLLTNGELYSFWVTSSAAGASNGYVGANGPGFTGPTDTLGTAAYPTAAAAPEISPAGGDFANSVTVSIYEGTLGATVNYTVDGTTPTLSSPVDLTPPTSPRLSASRSPGASMRARDWNPRPALRITIK